MFGSEPTWNYLVQDVLKSGGMLLVFEHVLNPRGDGWQEVWAPVGQSYLMGVESSMDRDTEVTLKLLV